MKLFASSSSSCSSSIYFNDGAWDIQLCSTRISGIKPFFRLKKKSAEYLITCITYRLVDKRVALTGASGILFRPCSMIVLPLRGSISFERHENHLILRSGFSRSALVGVRLFFWYFIESGRFRFSSSAQHGRLISCSTNWALNSVSGTWTSTKLKAQEDFSHWFESCYWVAPLHASFLNSSLLTLSKKWAVKILHTGFQK